MLSISQRKYQPPGSGENTPVPSAAGAEVEKQVIHGNDSCLSSQSSEINPINETDSRLSAFKAAITSMVQRNGFSQNRLPGHGRKTFDEYERRKNKIRLQCLSSKEYEREINHLCRELKI